MIVTPVYHIPVKKARKIFGWLDRSGKVIYNECGAYREA
jgi:hypothetical protein